MTHDSAGATEMSVSIVPPCLRLDDAAAKTPRHHRPYERKHQGDKWPLRRRLADELMPIDDDARGGDARWSCQVTRCARCRPPVARRHAAPGLLTTKTPLSIAGWARHTPTPRLCHACTYISYRRRQDNAPSRPKGKDCFHGAARCSISPTTSRRAAAIFRSACTRRKKRASKSITVGMARFKTGRLRRATDYRDESPSKHQAISGWRDCDIRHEKRFRHR